MNSDIEYYDIKQTKAICGYPSVHMIDYLCREDLIFPVAANGRGRGRKRLFSFQDLLVLKIYRSLFDAGISVSNLKQALIESEEFGTLSVTRQQLKYGKGARGKNDANVFMVSNEKIFIRSTTNDIVEVGTGGQYVFSFMVSLQNLHEQLSSDTLDIRHYRKELAGTGYYKLTEEQMLAERARKAGAAK